MVSVESTFQAYQELSPADEQVVYRDMIRRLYVPVKNGFDVVLDNWDIKPLKELDDAFDLNNVDAADYLYELRKKTMGMLVYSGIIDNSEGHFKKPKGIIKSLFGSQPPDYYFTFKVRDASHFFALYSMIFPGPKGEPAAPEKTTEKENEELELVKKKLKLEKESLAIEKKKEKMNEEKAKKALNIEKEKDRKKLKAEKEAKENMVDPRSFLWFDSTLSKLRAQGSDDILISVQYGLKPYEVLNGIFNGKKKTEFTIDDFETKSGASKTTMVAIMGNSKLYPLIFEIGRKYVRLKTKVDKAKILSLCKRDEFYA